ncbi:hypothetical protein BpHYR1_005627, partial [Brachionus plicatilis]
MAWSGSSVAAIGFRESYSWSRTGGVRAASRPCEISAVLLVLDHHSPRSTPQLRNGKHNFIQK